MTTTTTESNAELTLCRRCYQHVPHPCYTNEQRKGCTALRRDILTPAQRRAAEECYETRPKGYPLVDVETRRAWHDRVCTAMERTDVYLKNATQRSAVFCNIAGVAD